MPLITNLLASIVGNHSKSLDLTSPTGSPTLAVPVQLASGTADGQADVVWSDTRTIAASGTDDLDLRGVLINEFGDVVNFVEVVAVIVSAAAANTNNVVVGNAAATQFVGPMGAATHTFAIKPGGFFMWYAPAGWPSAAGSTDLLRIANSGAGTSVDYSIIIIGRSA